jgi:hypothetical protein
MRKSTGGSFKQPYSADPTSPSGYLTPVTPLDRRLHSAGPGYHHHRVPEIMGSLSPIPTNRSVYSADSNSPSVPSPTRSCALQALEANATAINGHSVTRYQPQQVRPYGQATNGYLPDPRATAPKPDTSQRPTPYMAVSLLEHQGPTLKLDGK